MSEPSGGGEYRGCLLAGDRLFTLIDYGSEGELERLLVSNAQHAFGSNSIYLLLKQRVESKVKMRVTDGLLLDLNDPKAPRFWIVEVELASHDPYRSIEPQIRGFLRALKSEETLGKIRDTLYEELQRHPEWASAAQRAVGGELHYALTRLLHEGAGVIIVIDRVTPQLEELTEEFTGLYGVETRLLEFRTYRHGEEQIHAFTPLIYRVTEEKPFEHMRSWEACLEWATPEARSLTGELIRRIGEEFPLASHKPKGRWYYFNAADRSFCVLLLYKRSVHVRILTDPARFRDSKGISKEYRGWFWRRGGRERGFTVTSKDDLEYALGFVKQAYEWVGK